VCTGTLVHWYDTNKLSGNEWSGLGRGKCVRVGKLVPMNKLAGDEWPGQGGGCGERDPALYGHNVCVVDAGGQSGDGARLRVLGNQLGALAPRAYTRPHHSST